MFRSFLALAVLFTIAAPLSAQTTSTSSIAAEADAIAYGLPGYSAIVSVTTPSKIQFAIGIGRYEVPSFLLKGDDHFDAAQWEATATSVQVARVTYRFRGAMKSGPAIGAVVLNQKWKLRSDTLDGETTFRPLNIGITAGYYIHFGEHFYVYPTTAFTYNRVLSGSTAVKGTSYHVERFAPNGSVHVGWEWGR